MSPRNLREHRTTILAVALAGIAVAIVVAVASGALVRDAPDRPGRAPAPAREPDVAQTIAKPVRTVYVGLRDCSDDRSEQEASQAATPWCDLNQALTRAPRRTRILVQPGRYPKIEISGRGQLDLSVSPSGGPDSVSVAGAKLSDVSGVRLTGLRFTESVGLENVSNATIDRNRFASTTLFARGARAVRVVGNQIGRLRGDTRAILFQGALRSGERRTQDVLIKDNRIDDIEHDGIAVYNGYRRVTIIGNHITRVRQPSGVGFHTDAIQLTGGTGLQMRDNRIEDVTHGVIIKDFEATTNAVIANNVVADVHGAALQVYNAPGVRIEHNTFWRTQVSVVLNNDPAVKGTTSATIRDNVMQQFVSEPGAVATASGNVFRYGSGVGEPRYQGSPHFRGARNGDYRLRERNPGAGVPEQARLPGTSLAARP